MRPATETMPKAMLTVAGRPFASWQLELLRRNGVRKVLYAVGHLGELIEDYVGDGSQWELSVSYTREFGELRGTGGALRLALDEGLLDDRFFVLYGDSYLPVDMKAIERHFLHAGRPALMTVYRNDDRWGNSNTVFNQGEVVLYDKRPTARTGDMRYIDYGLSVIERVVIAYSVPPLITFDLADVLSRLSKEGKLAGYEVQTPFYEVGSPEGLQDLENLLLARVDRRTGRP